MKPSMFTLPALLSVGLAMAQGPAPIIQHTFADKTEGWAGIGPTAKVSVTKDVPAAPESKGALRFDYKVAAGEFNALYLPTPVDTMTNAKSLRFRLRADAPSLMAVVLQEEDGGRYVAMLNTPKDQWQPVELSTADFILSQEKNDPVDPDQKLDLNKVNAIILADVSQFFVNDPAAAMLMDVQKGARAVYLESFSVGTDPLKPSTVSAGDDVQLDTFAHPQVGWLGLGGMTINRIEGKPLTGAGLKASYQQSSKPAILMRGLSPWVLSGAKALKFDVASDKFAKVMVQVEEKDGGKYNTTFDVPGGAAARKVEIPFRDFLPSQDSKDANGKLDLANVKNIVFLDVTGIIGTANEPNSLYLNNLIAAAK